MHRVNRSALVPFSADQMFRLVEDVERYPEFLPWCADATLHSREGNVVVGSVLMSKGALKRRFKTRNVLTPGERMTLELIDGPFRTLDGEWVFEAIEDAGSKVSLNIQFDFDQPITERLLGRFFEDICNSLVRAFTDRAMDIYGP